MDYALSEDEFGKEGKREPKCRNAHKSQDNMRSEGNNPQRLHSKIPRERY